MDGDENILLRIWERRWYCQMNFSRKEAVYDNVFCIFKKVALLYSSTIDINNTYIVALTINPQLTLLKGTIIFVGNTKLIQGSSYLNLNQHIWCCQRCFCCCAYWFIVGVNPRIPNFIYCTNYNRMSVNFCT